MNGGRAHNFQFLKYIVLTLVVVAVLAVYPLAQYADTDIMQGVIAGVLLSVVNVLMGYAAIEYSFNKSYTRFIQVMLGGIAVRLFVMVVVLLVLIGIFKVHAFALVGTLFAMYIIFLAEEVLYIHNKWSATRQQQMQN